jgi:hypothetical protein
MGTETQYYVIDATLIPEKDPFTGLSVSIGATTKQLVGHQGLADEQVSAVELLTPGVEDGNYTLIYSLLGKNHSSDVRVYLGNFLTR